MGYSPTYTAQEIANDEHDAAADAKKTIAAGCTMTVVNMTDNSTTVSSAPALLLGIYVNIALDANACSVKDATTEKLSLPASLAAGTKIDCHSATFATSLIIDPVDAAASGQIVVFWRAV